jgi:hypothetical protein
MDYESERIYKIAMKVKVLREARESYEQTIRGIEYQRRQAEEKLVEVAKKLTDAEHEFSVNIKRKED